MDKDVWYIAALLFVLQLIATTVITYYLKKWLADRDKKQEEKDSARINYENVSLEVNIASAKLAYALAMAWKRGEPNGEVEAGIKAYNEAMKNQDEFLRTQALYTITK